jgi:hypothetical protein
MDLSKITSSKEFKKSVVVDFQKHLFDVVEYVKKILWL